MVENINASVSAINPVFEEITNKIDDAVKKASESAEAVAKAFEQIDQYQKGTMKPSGDQHTEEQNKSIGKKLKEAVTSKGKAKKKQ